MFNFAVMCENTSVDVVPTFYPTPAVTDYITMSPTYDLSDYPSGSPSFVPSVAPSFAPTEIASYDNSDKEKFDVTAIITTSTILGTLAFFVTGYKFYKYCIRHKPFDTQRIMTV
jgi:hypothetical protein